MRIPRNYFLQQLLDVINEVENEEQQEQQEIDATVLSKREIADNYLDEFEPMLHWNIDLFLRRKRTWIVVYDRRRLIS